MKNDVKIRVVDPERDVDGLLAIYAPYVLKTAITFEYDIPTREDFLGRIRETMKRFPYIVAELNGDLVGYAYCGVFHARKAYEWTVETSIYVDENKKGFGIGRKLYDALEEILKRQHVSNMYACIAHTDVEDETLTNDSMRFHEHFGYKLVGTFKTCGYKFNRWYNMIWMEKMIGDHPENPEEFIPFALLADLTNEDA